MTTDDPYAVDQTSLIDTSAKYRHSDIALTGLFTAHVALLNSERHAIWQRYSAMLLANSIVLGFLAREARDLWEMRGAAGIGLILCLAWWAMSHSGWKLFRMFEDAGLRFSWPELGKESNPILVQRKYEGGRKGGLIRFSALGVICVFMAAYILLWANFQTP